MANEVFGHEPLTQIGASLMKHRTSRDRVLMAAFGALEDAWPRRQMICLGVLALVASKAIRPTQLGECLNTGVSNTAGDHHSSMFCPPTPARTMGLFGNIYATQSCRFGASLR